MKIAKVEMWLVFWLVSHWSKSHQVVIYKTGHFKQDLIFCQISKSSQVLVKTLLNTHYFIFINKISTSASAILFKDFMIFPREYYNESDENIPRLNMSTVLTEGWMERITIERQTMTSRVLNCWRKHTILKKIKT